MSYWPAKIFLSKTRVLWDVELGDCKKSMKNLLLYYLAILAPISLLSWMGKTHNDWFAVAMIFYALVYRTLIDGLRLAGKHLIKPTEIYKLLIPFSRSKFFRQLYFER